MTTVIHPGRAHALTCRPVRGQTRAPEETDRAAHDTPDPARRRALAASAVAVLSAAASAPHDRRVDRRPR